MQRSGNRVLFRILVAKIINPVYDDLIPRVAAFQQESKVRIFGNPRTHIAGGDNLIVMGDCQYLNVMCGNGLIGGFVAVPAMFHGVGNQRADLGIAVQPLGAYFYARHVSPRSRQW